MARFYENSMNQPSRPQRPINQPMPPGPMPPPTPPRPPQPRNRDDVPERRNLPARRGEMPERRNLPYFPGRDDGQIMPMPRQLPTNPIMPSPRPQRPMSPPMPMPPGLEGQDRLMPPAGSFDRQAGQSMREGLSALMSLLTAPSRVARGAVEGGVQAINPDFEMSDFRDAQIPGVDFMNFITGSAAQDQGRPMPRISDTQQEAEARLRAYLRQMQGGE